jgi:hypothetical protein
MSIIETLQKVNSDYNHVSQVRNQARPLSLLLSSIYMEAVVGSVKRCGFATHNPGEALVGSHT